MFHVGKYLHFIVRCLPYLTGGVTIELNIENFLGQDPVPQCGGNSTNITYEQMVKASLNWPC